MNNLKTGLSNNQLKIIAMFAMLTDHIGRVLLPKYEFLLIIGRLAFPIFSYMIAEGCKYTSNKIKYLLTVFGLGFICQTVFFIATDSLYQNILITFSLSILTAFSIDNFLKKKDFLSGLLLILELVGTVFISVFLPQIIKGNFNIDYGIVGVFIPVFIRFAPNKNQKIIIMTALLAVLACSMNSRQWFALLAIPLIVLYNGKRGKMNLKYMFYIFYPVHLAVIYLVDMLIN